MAALTAPPEDRRDTQESPMLVIFAALIIVAVVAIGVMLAVPTVVTAAVAFATVVGFAGALVWLLARVIGE